MGVLNTTPVTWVAGTVPPAATFNTEIRDALTLLQAAWTSYTPALTAVTTNPTLGTGGASGAYNQAGKTITGNGRIAFGASGSTAGSGLYAVSVPVAILAADVTGGGVIGSGIYFDSSAAAAAQYYHVDLIAVSSTTCRLIIHQSGAMSAVNPVIPAASDAIRFQFDYQAA